MAMFEFRNTTRYRQTTSSARLWMNRVFCLQLAEQLGWVTAAFSACAESARSAYHLIETQKIPIPDWQ